MTSLIEIKLQIAWVLLLFLNFTEVPFITYTGVRKDNSRKTQILKELSFYKKLKTDESTKLHPYQLTKKPINENWPQQI